MPDVHIASIRSYCCDMLFSRISRDSRVNPISCRTYKHIPAVNQRPFNVDYILAHAGIYLNTLTLNNLNYLKYLYRVEYKYLHSEKIQPVANLQHN